MVPAIYARAIFQVLYPFLGEDELDALQLAYNSFAENRLSPALVFDFVVYMILKGREPRFLEVHTEDLTIEMNENIIMKLQDNEKEEEDEDDGCFTNVH